MKVARIFKINEQTYVEFCTRTAGKKSYLTVGLTAIAILVISIVLKFGETTGKSILIGCIYAAAYALLVIVFSLITTKSAAKRAFKKNGLDHYEVHYTLDENGIEQAVKEGDPYRLKWSELKSVDETKLAFYFYISSSQAVVVGKEGVSEEEIKTIRELVKTNVTKKVKLLEEKK